jgi:hypothetical protein
VEIPVHYHSRSFSEGKKVTLLGDPLSWVRACFKYRFAPIYRGGRPTRREPVSRSEASVDRIGPPAAS